jgi:2-polyprenyl-6-methoxyphenol hydroxylase-like FAD-dependent oxidoreductase
MKTESNFIIVGGALAGALAAQTLREEGFDGRITLLSEEPHRPYERPPLSKDHLQGKTDRDSIFAPPGGVVRRPRGRAAARHQYVITPRGCRRSVQPLGDHRFKMAASTAASLMSTALLPVSKIRRRSAARSRKCCRASARSDCSSSAP